MLRRNPPLRSRGTGEGVVSIEGVAKESKCPASEIGGAGRDGGFAPPASPRKTFGCPLVIEVVEEYVGLGLRHGDPAIRVDGEPCEDDLQLRVTWKVVTVVTGRAEEIGVEPAIVSVLSLLRVWVADSG